MEKNYSDWIGVTKSRLTVIGTGSGFMHGEKKRRRYLICRCVCGNIRHETPSKFKRSTTLSCGCIRDERNRVQTFIDGRKKHPLYGVWRNMIDRCRCETHRAYKHYGARGISVCERWQKDFTAFITDMGEKPTPKHSIDRINNDGNYEPSNCRWATAKEQANNKRQRRKKQSSPFGEGNK